MLKFFDIIGASNALDAKKIATELGISLSTLEYYNSNNILPSGKDLELILSKLNISEEALKLKLGIFDNGLEELLSEYSEEILKILPVKNKNHKKAKTFSPGFSTDKGHLYKGDCLEILSGFKDETYDVIFADPPFNLNKLYPSDINDNLKKEEYISWSHRWLNECVRLLKPGGSFFVWNLPKWNIIYARFLEHRLFFKNWISVDIKYRLPIQGRLYPSHYSLLYFTKGIKPAIFHPDKLPMETCRKCFTEIKDYGGYKDKMNPKGITLSDVWTDIPPVRHVKYKGRTSANELSIKLLDRIIEMSSDEDSLILDPFGGSGTTYIVAEIKNRRWTGIEIGSLEEITNRFKRIDKEKQLLASFRSKYNKLFPDEIHLERRKRNIWTPEQFVAIVEEDLFG